MRTIGETLYYARTAKKLSYKTLEDKTKIKSEFVKFIEQERWEKLPEYPIVLGFVKNISPYLGLNADTSAALLRRDYSLKTENKVKYNEIGKKIGWNPKSTFVLSIAVVVLTVGLYLSFQYYKFISPPSLEITVPREGQMVAEGELTVTGKTDQDAVVKINNQPGQVDEEGVFQTQLQIDKSVDKVVVTAISRSQKETTRTIGIRVE